MSKYGLGYPAQIMQQIPSKGEIKDKWRYTSTLLCLRDGTGIVLILPVHSGRRVPLIG